MQKILPAILVMILTMIAPFLTVTGASSTPVNQTDEFAPETTPQQQIIAVPPKDNEPVFPISIEEPSKQTDKFFTEFLNMLATLGFIIALIFIIAWFFKRMMNSRLDQLNSTSLIRVIERRALSPKTSLYLLEIDSKTILVAETPNGITRLADFKTSEEEKEKSPSKEFPSPFSKMLEKKDES